MNWQIYFTKLAQKDAEKLSAAHLRAQTEKLLELISIDPFTNPPPYEKLVGDLHGLNSRRINIQHRLVYQVYQVYHEERAVKVIRMWSHYE